MALAEVGNAALEAAEEIPDAVDGSCPGSRLGILEVPLNGQANDFGAFAAVPYGFSIQLLDQAVGHADGDLALHGVHRNTMGCGSASSTASSLRGPAGREWAGRLCSYGRNPVRSWRPESSSTPGGIAGRTYRFV